MHVLTITTTLDLKGFSCPIPIARTAVAMKKMSPGEVLEVVATDPGSVPDFNAWAKATHNDLIEQTEDDGVYRFVLRKK